MYRAGEWRAALGLLEHMHKEQVMHSCMHACIYTHTHTHTHTHAHAHTQVTPDAVCYNYVISALSKGGQWDAALRLLREAEELFDREV